MKGTRLTVSVSDMMCLNSSSLRQPSACMNMKVHGAKDVGPTKVLKRSRCRSISQSMAQSHLSKLGASAAFEILLFLKIPLTTSGLLC